MYLKIYINLDTVFCYYQSWATYRQPPATFKPEDIDVNICTHVTYAFVGLNEDGSVRILDHNNEVQKMALSRFTGLRKINPKLKVLVSMGGWNEGSERYSRVIGRKGLRNKLVNSINDFLKKVGI